MKIKPVIFGVLGTELSQEEESFFKEQNPLGFILFSRNCKNAAQIKSLTENLRKAVSHDHLQILIDQEGGRVARLPCPEFHRYNPAGYFGELALQNLDLAKKATYLNFTAMSNELLSVGVNVNCAPVADLLFENAHRIIGNRSYGENVENVTELCMEAIRAMNDAGVTPVMKHIPGHGRAKLDSHEDLPIIDDEPSDLMKKDFLVFKNLSKELKSTNCEILCHAMTGHMQFSKISNEPTSFCKKTIDLIRHEIGFGGILMSDDLSMNALSGSYLMRTEKVLQAGCDLVLHCNGKMDEMKEIAKGITSYLPENKLESISKYDLHFDKNYNIDLALSEVNEMLSQYIS